MVAVFGGGSDLFIFLSGILHAGRNDDLHGNFFIDGRDMFVLVAVVKKADYGLLFALHDADDPSFSPAIVAKADQFDQHLVAVHGIADGGWGYKDIAIQFAADLSGQGIRFGDDKTKAIAMHTQTA